MRRPLDRVAVIFDLDGTLIDTAADLAAAMNHTLAAAGRPRVPLDRVRRLIGDGAKAMLRRGFLEAGAAAPDESELDAHVAVFIDYYRANIAAASRPFPGVIEVIEGFACDGATAVICTNKREALARALIDELGLTALFAGIVGGDTAGVAKPDPRPVKTCLNLAGASKAVFIGDSDTDILAATNSGIPCLVAEFGYGPLTLKQRAFASFAAYPETPDLIRKAASIRAA